MTYRYDFHGRLIERVDPRGLSMRYSFDALDRLTEIEVGYYSTTKPNPGAEPPGPGSYISGYPTWLEVEGLPVPAARIGYVKLVYGNDNKTFDAYAYSSHPLHTTGASLITHNRLQFDTRGNLANDYQSLGGAIDIMTTPKVQYLWSTGFVGGSDPVGFTRLSEMKYPHHAGITTNPRRVIFGYGVTGSASRGLSRIDTFNSTTATSGSGNAIANMIFVGTGRRVTTRWGANVVQQSLGLDTTYSGDNSVGVPGADRFGRIANMTYTAHSTGGTGTAVTLTQLAYGYSIDGERTTERRWPRPGGAFADGWSRAAAYEYDVFDRLTDSDVEERPSSGSATALYAEDWTLDLLGNQVEYQIHPAGGPADLVTHTPDGLNRLASIKHNIEPTITPVYDASGSLVFDGSYAYQYDAWGRLVRVCQAEADAEGFAPGATVKEYTYDGLGRLVRTVSPLPDPEEAPPGDTRSERYFYDGVRRVQELVTDATESEMMMMEGGGEGGESEELSLDAPPTGPPEPADAALHSIGEWEIDPDALPEERAEEESEGDGHAAVSTLTSTTWVEREYIWGPGDRGLDEILAQFDETGSAQYAMHDAGGDLIGLTDGNGTSNWGRKIRDVWYDPYGRVLHAADLVTGVPFETRIGHKGLFFDRLDAGVTDQALASGAVLVGYARNRHYLAEHRRWAQEDPNASGSNILALALHGAVDAPYIQLGDADARLGDGPFIAEYLGSSPLTRHDPEGLEYWGDFVEGGHELVDRSVEELEEIFNAVNSFLSFTDASGLIGSMLESMVAQYSANLDSDSAWASDWSYTDNIHSRMSDDWVELALIEGAIDHFGLEELLGGDDDTGPVMAGKYKGTGKSKLKGVSRALYTKRVKEFKANKSRYWQDELRAHPKRYNAADRKRIRDGSAPIRGGKPMEIHHHKPLSRGGTNAFDNLDFMSRKAHRIGPNFRRNHRELFE